jgi:hypothetical protein
MSMGTGLSVGVEVAMGIAVAVDVYVIEAAPPTDQEPNGRKRGTRRRRSGAGLRGACRPLDRTGRAQ